MSKPNNLKPVYWLLFAAGGMISALILPALIVILSGLLPFNVVGDADVFYHSLSPWFQNHGFYIVVVAILLIVLWHTAHRFYYVLHDFHIHVGNRTRYALYAGVILCGLWTLMAGW